jgi:hypothetical protein
VPAYSRELVRIFLVAEETRTMRRTIHERYVALMASVLRDGQATGDIVTWADPIAIATRMFAHYVHAMIEWAEGDLDDDEFTAATELGMALMLLGLARGRAARALAARAAASQRALTPPKRRRARKGG